MVKDSSNVCTKVLFNFILAIVLMDFAALLWKEQFYTHFMLAHRKFHGTLNFQGYFKCVQISIRNYLIYSLFFINFHVIKKLEALKFERMLWKNTTLAFDNTENVSAGQKKREVRLFPIMPTSSPLDASRDEAEKVSHQKLILYLLLLFFQLPERCKILLFEQLNDFWSGQGVLITNNSCGCLPGDWDILCTQTLTMTLEARGDRQICRVTRDAPRNRIKGVKLELNEKSEKSAERGRRQDLDSKISWTHFISSLNKLYLTFFCQ